MSKDKFLKVYANLPEPEREQIIAIVNDRTYSWNVAFNEISGDTELGKLILKKNWTYGFIIKMEEFNVEEEKKRLVLERFKTLNPESKIMLDGAEEMSVRDLIVHVEKGDDFGRKVVQVQMNMLKILSNGV